MRSWLWSCATWVAHITPYSKWTSKVRWGKHTLRPKHTWLVQLSMCQNKVSSPIEMTSVSLPPVPAISSILPTGQPSPAQPSRVLLCFINIYYNSTVIRKMFTTKLWSNMNPLNLTISFLVIMLTFEDWCVSNFMYKDVHWGMGQNGRTMTRMYFQLNMAAHACL